MARGRKRTRSRKKPTVRSNRAYIRKVDLRDRPPLKALLEATGRPIPLDFVDTLLLHKTTVAGIGTPWDEAAYAAPKTLSNTDDEGATLGATVNSRRDTQGQTHGGATHNNDVAYGYLECYRPLLYENKAYLAAMCQTKAYLPGGRKARVLPSCVVSGKFTITLHEGVNQPTLWTDHVRLVNHGSTFGSGGDAQPNGTTNYGQMSFTTPQFVRVLLVKVTDMGKGLGKGKETAVLGFQNGNNPNFRNDEAAGVGTGKASTCDMHLLAPSIGEIFDDVEIDPHGNYLGEGVPANYHTNPDLIGYKFTKNSPAQGTPYIGEPDLGSQDGDPVVEWFDPLRGSSRRRKFHVMKDKIIAFSAGGTQNTRVNQPGAKIHEMKYSYMIKNQRFQMDFNENPLSTTNTIRSRENMKDRYIWYFMPSCSPYLNGLSIIGDPGSGHHAFSVDRENEKVHWTEKCDH